MTDLATLGLAVDSKPVKEATTALDQFSKAGKTAEQQASAVVAAMAKGKPGAQAFAQGFQEVDKQQGNLSSSSQKVIGSLNDQFVRLNTTERQWRIIQNVQKAGVDLNSTTGQSIAKMTGALYDMERAQDKVSYSHNQLVASITRRLIFAFIASEARSAIRFVLNLNAALAATGDVANRIGVTSNTLQNIGATAGFKGIGQSDFEGALLNFNKQVDLAKNGLGDLAALMRANGVSASNTEDAFFKIADLVKNAATDAQKFSIVQQAGFPATVQFVKYLEQGGDALRRARDEVDKTGLAISDDLIQKAKEFDAEWNKTWTTWTMRGKFAIAAVFQGLQIGGDLATLAVSGPNGLLTKLLARDGKALGDAADVYGAVGIRAPASVTVNRPTVDPKLVQQQLGLEQQRIGILGNMATVQEQVRSKEIEIQIARMNGVRITAQEAEGLRQVTRDRALGIDQIRAQIDALNTETGALGMSAGQMATYTAVQNRLNEAKRNHQILSPAEVDAIKREGDALGQAAQRADDARFQYDTFKNTFVEFGQNLRNGQSLWDSFGQAGFNALGKIADKLMSMAADNLWRAAFPSGGGFNLFSIFNAAAPVASANGNVFMDGLDAYSNSIVTKPTMFAFASGMGLMGEAGPEAVMPLTRGADGKLGVASAGGGATIINITTNNDLRGVDPSMKAWIQAQQRASEARTLAAVPGVVAKARSNRPGLLGP